MLQVVGWASSWGSARSEDSGQRDDKRLLCAQLYHSITNAMTLAPGEALEPVTYSNPAPQMLQNRRSSKRGDRGGVSEIEAIPEKHPQQVSAEKPRPAVSSCPACMAVPLQEGLLQVQKVHNAAPLLLISRYVMRSHLDITARWRTAFAVQRSASTGDRGWALTGGWVAVQCLAGVEGLAILTSADYLLDIQRVAVDNDIEPSPGCVGGWKVWVTAVRTLGQGHLPPGSTGKSFG